MKIGKKLFAIVITMVAFAFPFTAKADTEAKKVDLLFVHDIHSHLNTFSTVENGETVKMGGLSRIKTFIRFEEKIQSSFLNLNDFYNLLMDKDFSDTKNSDKMKFYRDKCPKYIQLEPLIKLSSNKDKILSILSGDL